MAVRGMKGHVEKLPGMEIWQSWSGPVRMAVRVMNGRLHSLRYMEKWMFCSGSMLLMATRGMNGHVHWLRVMDTCWRSCSSGPVRMAAHVTMNSRVQKLQAMDNLQSWSGPIRMVVHRMNGHLKKLPGIGNWRSWSGPTRMAVRRGMKKGHVQQLRPMDILRSYSGSVL
jgi:hypothetical protein